MKGILIQEFKTLVKSPASFSILIIPIVLMVGLGYLIPSAWIIPSAITIGIVGSVLLYFGGSLEEIKRTSFMKSISLTKLNKFTFLFNKILFSVFISFISIIWVLFFGWFFTEVVPFLTNDFKNLLPPNSEGIISFVRGVPFSVNWEKINWLLMFYSGIMTIIISISISFVFVAFSKSSLSFYLMSFGYLLAMILFGGVVMPSFLISSDNSWFKTFYYFVPNYYTNNVMAESFGNGLGQTIGSLTKPILNHATENNIYLGSVLNSLSGQLDKILSDTVLKDVIHDYNLLSEDRLNDISDFLKNDFFLDDKNYGTLSKLSFFNQDNKYEKFLFDIFNLPTTIDSNVQSWQEILKKILIDNGVPSFTVGLATSQIRPIMNQILIDPLLKNPSNIISNIIHTFLTADKDLEGIIHLILPDLVLPHELFTEDGIELYKLIDSFDIQIPALLNLIKTLDGMFNTASSVDYIIPWLETVGFLGIAVVFFKWS